MKKLTCTLTTLCMAIILLCTSSAQGMESNPSFSEQIYNQLSHLVSMLWTPNQYIQRYFSWEIEKNNNSTCLLTSLPKETLIEVFSHCLANDINQEKSLKNSIENFMKMNTVCKKFNDLLTFETIGDLCKNYPQGDKNQVFKNLIHTMDDFTYTRKRLPALILIYAGADANISMGWDYLLECVLRASNVWSPYNNDDTQMIKILFQHHADPNVKDPFGTPLFFNVKRAQMAHMFLDNKDFNVHATNDNGENVLWYLTRRNSPSELIKLYLAHNVDTKKLSPYDNSCLLHALANRPPYKDIKVYEFFKKAKLLLNVIPDMVNTLNNKKKTPIDIALKSIKICCCTRPRNITALEQLIALFEEHGGKTGKEIQKASMILLLHNDDHLGDLSLLPRDVRRCIVQYMHYLNK